MRETKSLVEDMTPAEMATIARKAEAERRIRALQREQKLQDGIATPTPRAKEVKPLAETDSR